MNPNDPKDNRPASPHIPQRSVQQASIIPDRSPRSQHNEAAANVVRSQLDSIYNGNTTTPTPQTTPVVTTDPTDHQTLDTPNPYDRTHGVADHIQTNQWEKYHSAWQDYYQKYYERYYLGQVYHARKALEERAKQAAVQTTAATPPTQLPDDEPETLTHDEAMYDLRSRLLQNIRSGASKVRKSRHFVPITAAVCVIIIFLFLQFNRILIANVEAYISPGGVDPANIIINPSTDVAVSQDPKLIIPKINVDVPVIYDTTPDYNAQMAAMQKGVAWFGIAGANSRPGQVGNTVLSGHSSNDLLDQGDYKFIFARLDHLDTGDAIFVNYQGKRYTYTVTGKQVVKPTDVSALVYPTTKPILTLITCTPLGTSLNRLLVTAEQVSPDPSNASAAPANSGNSSTTTEIPGNSPTFLQRLFGGTNG